jgi:hypothetical protein
MIASKPCPSSHQAETDTSDAEATFKHDQDEVEKKAEAPVKPPAAALAATAAQQGSTGPAVSPADAVTMRARSPRRQFVAGPRELGSSLERLAILEKCAQQGDHLQCVDRLPDRYLRRQWDHVFFSGADLHAGPCARPDRRPISSRVAGRSHIDWNSSCLCRCVHRSTGLASVPPRCAPSIPGSVRASYL